MSSQVKAVLALEKMSSNTGDSVHWKATIKELALFSDDGIASPLFTTDREFDTRTEKEALVLGTQRVVSELRAATLEIVQRKNGQILKVETKGVTQKAALALKQTPTALRGDVRLQIAPLLDANYWKALLSAQTPRLPTSRAVGKTWDYVPETFGFPMSFLKSKGGISKIRSLQGEGDTPQINVISMAQIDFVGQPFPDFGKHAFEYHSAITSHTRFGTQLWPLEQASRERAHLLLTTSMEDQNETKPTGLTETTTEDFQFQTRLVVQPFK